MDKLLAAARVFNLRIPEGVSDDELVGMILSTPVYAGEIRRLNKAIRDLDDENYFLHGGPQC